MRTIIDLTNEQTQGLSQLCQKEHISRAEAIRRAVEKYLTQNQGTSENLNQAFGLWRRKKKSVDGIQYQQQLRSDWER